MPHDPIAAFLRASRTACRRIAAELAYRRALAHSARSARQTPRVQRPALAGGAVLGILSLAGIPVLMAGADRPQGAPVAAEVQSYQAHWYPALATARDGYSISTFTVVQWPVPADTRISSYYGYRGGQGVPSDHGGIDLNPGQGFPVQSIAEGVVVEASTGGGVYGVYAVVEHNVNGDIVRTLYGHMEYGSLTVGVGDTVSRGQVLGTVGSTGLSTGPHLHFEVSVNGVEVDPLPWLQSNANS